jgi:hypothetical protein
MIRGLLWSIQLYTLQLRASYVGFILTLHRRSPCVVYFSAGWYSCIPPTASVCSYQLVGLGGIVGRKIFGRVSFHGI